MTRQINKPQDAECEVCVERLGLGHVEYSKPIWYFSLKRGLGVEILPVCISQTIESFEYGRTL